MNDAAKGNAVLRGPGHAPYGTWLGRIGTLGAAGGISVVVAFELIEMLKTQPAMLSNVGWPVSIAAITLGGFFLLDRRAGQGIRALNEMAAANTGLTSAVQQLAQKDDRRTQATDAAIGYVAQQNEEILRELNEIKRRLPEP